jgi:hypothetical protein
MTVANFSADLLVDVEAGGSVSVETGGYVRYSTQTTSSLNGIVSGVDLSIEGVGLKPVVVAQAPNLSPGGRPLIGAGQLDVILKAEAPGDATVTVVPVHASGHKGGGAAFQVSVTPAKQ